MQIFLKLYLATINMKFNHSLTLYLFSGLIVSLFEVTPVLAQITADGTTSTNVDSEGNDFTISEGNQRGENLFHSFRDFSVPNGGSAFFDNSSDIVNIFSRVTGGNISSIDGLIRANDGANLFLINPAGIIFGEGGSLDIGGSFYGSTADSILFPDGIEFSATNTQAEPILSINAPIGLNFRNNSRDITANKSTLQVDRGKTLAIVGGNLNLKGSSLIARQGRIELGSTINNDLVNLNETAQGFVLDYGAIENSGEIQLTTGAIVETSGKGGGAIQIQGGLLNLADGSSIIADSKGSGNGVGINLNINQLVVRDGSQISASSLEESQGDSGGIIVNAVESVRLIGTSSQEPNNGSGGGQGNGSGGGQGSGSAGGGQGNNNNPRQGETPSRLSIDNRGNGKSGNLIINTKQLFVLDGGRISAPTDSSEGGSIIINASELVELAGVSAQRARPSALSVQTRGVGTGGNLIVETRKLMVRNGAEILASTFGEGDGGNILLTATESIEIIGSLDTSPSIIGAETGTQRDLRREERVVSGTGNAGNITINTTNLLIGDGATITVSSNESDIGSSGQLKITADSLELNRGTIKADTAVESGGNIELQVGNTITLSNGSQISAAAREGANGGNIDIDTTFVVARPNQNSDIIASAERGMGGRISISAEGIFGIEERILSDRTNDIDASGGVDGEVTITTPDVDITRGALKTLQNISNTEQIVAQACQVANSSSNSGSFNILGKGGVPLSATAPLNSDSIIVDAASTTPNLQTQPPNIKPIKTQYGDILIARGIIKTEDGRVILTAYPTHNTQRSPVIQDRC